MVAAAYLRETRTSSLISGHIGWRTSPLSLAIGLKHECSVTDGFR